MKFCEILIFSYLFIFCFLSNSNIVPLIQVNICNKAIFSLLEKYSQFTILIQINGRFFIEGQHAGPALFTFTLYIGVNDQIKTDTEERTPSAINSSNLVVSLYISLE